MQRQRRRDTKPEVEVRRLLHAAGVRFRVDAKLEPDLRIRGDIVWRGRKVVVFLDGCFWHGCPTHATQPKANADWWREKLVTNVIRDLQTDAELAARGWTVLRYWEHEAPADVAADVESFVRAH
jgi:DNA mismatch endonuclease (patch repair protein)